MVCPATPPNPPALKLAPVEAASAVKDSDQGNDVTSAEVPPPEAVMYVTSSGAEKFPVISYLTSLDEPLFPLSSSDEQEVSTNEETIVNKKNNFFMV